MYFAQVSAFAHTRHAGNYISKYASNKNTSEDDSKTRRYNWQVAFFYELPGQKSCYEEWLNICTVLHKVILDHIQTCKLYGDSEYRLSGATPLMPPATAAIRQLLVRHHLQWLYSLTPLGS